MERKIRLHLTEVIDFCPKRFWFRLNNYPQSVTHIYSLRGTLVHKVIESFLKGDIDDINETTVNSIAKEENLNKVIERQVHYDFVMRTLSNFEKWFRDKLKDSDNVYVENELHINFDDITLTGTPDLVILKDDIGMIIDFKTGSRVLPTHELQLVGYAYMLKKSEKGINIPIERIYDVYLGGDEYKEFEVKEIDGRYKEFEKILEDVIQKVRNIVENKKMPVGVVSNKCIFCRYRGICDGV